MLGPQDLIAQVPVGHVYGNRPFKMEDFSSGPSNTQSYIQSLPQRGRLPLRLMSKGTGNLMPQGTPLQRAGEANPKLGRP